MSRHRRQHRRDESVGDESKNLPQGLNLNNLDLGSIANLINNIDVNELSSFVGNLKSNSEDNNENKEENISIEVDEDTMRKNEIVKSITTLVNADKAELLQIIIQLYAAIRNAKK